MKVQAIWISVTAVLLGVSLWRPPFPFEQFLQHLPTVLGLAGLAAASRKKWLGKPSVVAICLFLGLHILGARYIYTYVPYDRWSEAIFGTSLGDLFGWRRNHYDRLVHLLYGLLACVPLYEIARRHAGLGRGWAVLFAAAGVTTTSAVYEVFEWMLTLFVSPEQATRYNGQQGDLWDAQKDMALAMAGVVAFAIVIAARARRWATSTMGEYTE
jgi:putative membrane protein